MSRRDETEEGERERREREVNGKRAVKTKRWSRKEERRKVVKEKEKRDALPATMA